MHLLLFIGIALKQTLQLFHAGVVREVYLDGDNGNVFVFQSPFVGVLSLGLVVAETTREPEVVPTARILVAEELLLPEAPGLAADAVALDLLGACHGHVDIEAQGGSCHHRQHCRDNLLGELPEMFSGYLSKEEVEESVQQARAPFLKHDPVEDTPEYLEIKEELETILYEHFKDVDQFMGFCFEYWSKKREILLSKYGIEWRSPSSMNPRVHFD